MGPWSHEKIRQSLLLPQADETVVRFREVKARRWGHFTRLRLHTFFSYHNVKVFLVILLAVELTGVLLMNVEDWVSDKSYGHCLL